jgi:hypothetical protein
MVATLLVGDAVRVLAPPATAAASLSANVALAPACVRVALTEKEGDSCRGEHGAPLPVVVPVPTYHAEPPGGLHVPPTSIAPRPLVVLDLNGVLVDRKPYGTRSHNSSLSRADNRRGGGGSAPGAYERRPFCDAFISFCFRHFDVAVRQLADAELKPNTVFIIHIPNIDLPGMPPFHKISAGHGHGHLPMIFLL